MLLTTTYCTYPKVTGIRPSLGFNLQTAIPLVNKQILVEATRILYHGNDFIILKVDTDKVLKRKWHSQEMLNVVAWLCR